MDNKFARLTPGVMLARSQARDAAFDGRFLTGVVTTGIYCLASCKARKPLPANVRFFRTEREAIAAGLRACRRCRPDDFLRKYDPDVELLEKLTSEARRDPSAFPAVADLVRRSGVGATMLHGMFRSHYHATPAAFLRESRIDFASRQLLETKTPLLDIAAEAGFGSASAFHANFLRRQRLTPAQYRELSKGKSFTLRLPARYRRDLTLSSFSRDPGSVSERLTGSLMEKAIEIEGVPVLLRIDLQRNEAHCTLESAAGLSTSHLAAAHHMVLRILGLLCDPIPFEAALRREGLESLIGDRTGLRVTQTATVFESLMWAIIGQQVNLPFAFKMRNAVISRWGSPIGGLYAQPGPAKVAEIEYGELAALQFSRSKAAYLIDAARQASTGELDLEALPSMRASAVRDKLLSIRGIGVWSANYVMMRGCNFSDCVPAGDTGLSSGLQKFFDLATRPTQEETVASMAVFAPHRSLATFHLWMFNRAVES